MTDTNTTITVEELNRLAFCNSKNLPHYIKFEVNGVMHYRWWVGIGWIETEPNDDAVLVVEE